MRALVGVLLFLLLGVSGCAGMRPAWLPARSCEKAWRRLPDAAARYDYGRDSRQTDRGNQGYDAYARRVDRASCYKDWTVLVYMEADNDLFPYAYLDLYEMEAGYGDGSQLAGSTRHTDVVVQLDVPGEQDARRLHMFQTLKPYDDHLAVADFAGWQARDIKSPIVALVPGQTGPGAGASLQDFLRWGLQRYPAEHYLVIVWGHGQGWAPSPSAAASPGPSTPWAGDGASMLPRSTNLAGPFAGRWFGGLAFDYTHQTYLDIPALHDALRTAEGEVLGGHPVDVYASDACLMQMVEVTTELSDSARFISGSTQIQNYYGLPYRSLLAEMNSGRYAGLHDPDPGLRLARLLPLLAEQSFAPDGLLFRLAHDQDGGKETLTMSSVSSAALQQELLPALSSMGTALSAYLREEPLHAAGLIQVLRDSPGFLGGTQDLGAFLDATRDVVLKESQGGAESPATADLLRVIGGAAIALGHTVIAQAFGSSYRDPRNQPRFPDFHVLSAWLPASAQDYAARISDFTPSRFYHQGQREGGPGPWQDWLDLVFRSAP